MRGRNPVGVDSTFGWAGLKQPWALGRNRFALIKRKTSIALIAWIGLDCLDLTSGRISPTLERVDANPLLVQKRERD